MYNVSLSRCWVTPPSSPPWSRCRPLSTPRSLRCSTATGTPRSSGSCVRCSASPARPPRTWPLRCPPARCSAASPWGRPPGWGGWGERGWVTATASWGLQASLRPRDQPPETVRRATPCCWPWPHPRPSHPRGHHSPEPGVILDMSQCWLGDKRPPAEAAVILWVDTVLNRDGSDDLLNADSKCIFLKNPGAISMIVLMNDGTVVKLYQVLATACPWWVWRWQEQRYVQYQYWRHLVTIVIEC